MQNLIEQKTASRHVRSGLNNLVFQFQQIEPISILLVSFAIPCDLRIRAYLMAQERAVTTHVADQKDLATQLGEAASRYPASNNAYGVRWPHLLNAALMSAPPVILVAILQRGVGRIAIDHMVMPTNMFTGNN
jgi:hypothetical protein